jgi:hypothetical protein
MFKDWIRQVWVGRSREAHAPGGQRPGPGVGSLVCTTLPLAYAGPYVCIAKLFTALNLHLLFHYGMKPRVCPVWSVSLSQSLRSLIDLDFISLSIFIFNSFLIYESILLAFFHLILISSFHLYFLSAHSFAILCYQYCFSFLSLHFYLNTMISAFISNICMSFS